MTTDINNDELVELLSLTIKIDEDGTVMYFDNNGLRHREFGPAVAFQSGTEHWYHHGRIQKIVKPNKEILRPM
jgi:hypothetical protein